MDKKKVRKRNRGIIRRLVKEKRHKVYDKEKRKGRKEKREGEEKRYSGKRDGGGEIEPRVKR